MMKSAENQESEMGSIDAEEHREEMREVRKVREFSDKEKTMRETRLSKRLAYLLRYGAEKEGLQVYEGGYVSLMDLLKVAMMNRYEPYHVLQNIKNSSNHRGVQRFEHKQENGTFYVRALYGRRMERNPNHAGTNVPRLLETCLDAICDNLDDYDLQDFPDEFLINTMIHKLRRKKNKLNNKAYRALLGPAIEHLDLGAVYLTEGTIKLIGQRCPNLRVLNLRECGYVMTDHFMEILMKKLKQLETLNLSGCHHLTDRSINAIIKNCANIQHLSLTGIKGISQDAILKLVTTCAKLEHVDVFYNRNFNAEGKTVLREIASQRGIVVLLNKEDCETLPGKTSESSKGAEGMSLPLASVSAYW